MRNMVSCCSTNRLNRVRQTEQLALDIGYSTWFIAHQPGFDLHSTSGHEKEQDPLLTASIVLFFFFVLC